MISDEVLKIISAQKPVVKHLTIRVKQEALDKCPEGLSERQFVQRVFELAVLGVKVATS